MRDNASHPRTYCHTCKEWGKEDEPLHQKNRWCDRQKLWSLATREACSDYCPRYPKEEAGR